MNNTNPPERPTPRETKVFIPARLDDADLRPNVFRVYCHISRRDGREGAWSSIAKMARVCRLHPQTVRKALRFLTGQGLLAATPRQGQTTIYHLTPMSTWR